MVKVRGAKPRLYSFVDIDMDSLTLYFFDICFKNTTLWFTAAVLWCKSGRHADVHVEPRASHLTPSRKCNPCFRLTLSISSKTTMLIKHSCIRLHVDTLIMLVQFFSLFLLLLCHIEPFQTVLPLSGLFCAHLFITFPALLLCHQPAALFISSAHSSCSLSCTGCKSNAIITCQFNDPNIKFLMWWLCIYHIID